MEENKMETMNTQELCESVQQTFSAESNTAVLVSQKASREILSTIGTNQPEQGGALGMNKDGVISHFYFDQEASVSGATYTPSNVEITNVIRQWEKDDIRFCGMIHSHPGRFGIPSSFDIEYAARILEAMPETLGGTMHMPIVTINPETQCGEIHWYIVKLDEKGNVKMSSKEYVVVDDIPTENGTDKVQKPVKCADPSELFKRNSKLFPLDVLDQKTVVVVGCGGARGFCESLARSAVGRFVLIDGDIVSATNVATQGTYIDEIGLSKTEVIAKTLKRINPNIEIIEVQRFLDDNFTDEELCSLIGESLLEEHPEDVLLCGCTDNFAAQDRTAKLALKWGVPYVAAQVYAEGRAAETIFTYPGVTEACPRCMLASRYQAYASGTPATVTSECSPIYATERMNALKSHIAMMLLLYGTDSRIGSELELVKNRNLILMSFTADCEEKLKITAFSRTLKGLDNGSRAALPMEETVWLEQKPDRPENNHPRCPYCAGTGDLRKVKPFFSDTRQHPNLNSLIQELDHEDQMT